MLDINKTKIEVRYQETDQMGVVYHANYIVWFEVGRVKYIESLGFTYAEMENEGILLPVIHVNANYKRSVKFGETVTIRARLKEYNGIRVILEYKVLNEEGDLATYGETEHTFVNDQTFKPIRLRNVKRKWHDAFMERIK